MTPTNAMLNQGTLLPVGSIVAVGGGFQQENVGWLLCNGENVSRVTYSRLFEVMGTTFGVGDGSSTFTLPDCQSRTLVGFGQGTGLSFHALGAYFGNETHTLTITEMPPHTHDQNVVTGSGGAGTSNIDANRNTTGTRKVTSSTGGGAAFNIVNPSMAVLYLIWSGYAAPEFSPSESSGPTLTPDGLMAYATVVFNGTPQPVAVRYEITGGEFVQTVLLFALCGLTILGMVLRARENHQ